MSTQGRVVWHDLNTTDLEGARRFYGELFAWTIKSEGPFAFIYPGDDPQAHFGTVIPIDPSRPMPPAWIPYIAVENIDRALGELPAAGGKPLMAKQAAGKTGHFAYAADPQGAVFSLWQYHEGSPKPELDPQTPPTPGQLIWDELLTSDPAAAAQFYTRLFGYQAQSMSQAGFDYTVWARPDAKLPDGKPRGAGGMMKLPPGVPHPFWLSYVWVADCDRSAAAAQRLGAHVVQPPMDIPTVGRFSSLLDPAGACIGILGPSPKA